MNGSTENVTESEVDSALAISDPGKIFSDHTRYLFELIVYTLMCGLISVVGISTNLTNIIIFYRQGPMSDSSNTSLLGLAVADLCCLTTMLWLSINYAVMLTDPSGIPWDPLSILYITGGWPHVMFTRVTCWITAFIALERCVCVSLPFKVKMLFTPKRSMCVIISIFSIVILAYTPIFYSHQLHWRLLPAQNVTKLVLVFTEDKVEIEDICHYINDVILPTICLTIVMVCTKITVSKINSSSRWRKSIASSSTAETSKSNQASNSPPQHHHHHQHQQEQPVSVVTANNKYRVTQNAQDTSVDPSSGSMMSTDVHIPTRDGNDTHLAKSSRGVQRTTTPSTTSCQKEKKVTRMVTLICIIFLVCNTPCILIIYLRFMVPEIANMRRYHNLFHVIYSIDFLLETFNSTINIVVYYTMSSRYKQEFNKLF